MYVPGWICHNHIELAQHSKVKVPKVAVDPLSFRDVRLDSFTSTLSLFVVGSRILILNIVDVLALRVQAGIEMRTVTRRLFGIRFDNLAEVSLSADSSPHSDALLLGTAVAVLDVFDVGAFLVLFNEGSFCKALHLAKLHYTSPTLSISLLRCCMLT